MTANKQASAGSVARALVIFALLAMTTGARVAAAPLAGDAAQPRPGVDRWQASLGLRGSLFRDAGYDPFSANDAFVQSAMTVSGALRTGPGFVPVLGLALDLGNADDVARGVNSHLGLSRVAVLFEQRWVPRLGFYVAGRVAPGVMRASATLRDPSAPASLETSYTSPSLDASLGAGARINSWAAPLGVWVVADAGYGWARRHALNLAPALPGGDAQKAGEVSLDALAARGPFLRVGLALSY